MHAYQQITGNTAEQVQNSLKNSQPQGHKMAYDAFLFIILMDCKQQRTSRIANIKNTLKKMTIVSKNSLQVQAREEKIRNRRQSLQLATDTFQSAQLMRKFSDEDEEEERNKINSFDEKYRLLEKIGEGGNATVFTCEYKHNNKIYAVKRVRMDEQHYLELKKNFLNIKALKHQSIIRYHALYFDLQKHLAYLIMEYFPYQNLLQLGLKDEERLRSIITQLLNAIVYIHQRNICHRDIKPQNILYDPLTKRIKLIDFGISKRTFQRGHRTDMLTIIGTRFYQAPEILMGGGYDEKVDLWSTGVTLFQLVTGITPFESQYHGQTIENITGGKVTYDGAIWSKYNPLIKDLTNRLLRPRNERLSAKQALKHPWLCQASTGRIRKSSEASEDKGMPRHDSGNLRVFRTIVQQQHLNMKHATSKQEGQDKNTDNTQLPRFVKSTRLNLMENMEFDLDDSSEEQTSPETAKKDVNGKTC